MDIIYKYRPWKDPYSSILRKNSLWFPSVKTLREIDKGDENEFKNYLDYSGLTEAQKIDFVYQIRVYRSKEPLKRIIEDTCAKIEEYKKKNWVEFNKLGELLAEESARKIGVCSFSKKNNLEYQWENYAESFNGVCIGFDFDSLINHTGGHWGPIIYDSYKHPIPSLNFMHDIFPVGFIKKQNFILEDEYRLNKFDFADKGYSLPSSVFKEIILGYKLFEKGNDILRDEILELIQNKFSAANISVAQKDTLNNVIIKKI